mgnify:FL=1
MDAAALEKALLDKVKVREDELRRRERQLLTREQAIKEKQEQLEAAKSTSDALVVELRQREGALTETEKKHGALRKREEECRTKELLLSEKEAGLLDKLHDIAQQQKTLSVTIRMKQKLIDDRTADLRRQEEQLRARATGVEAEASELAQAKRLHERRIREGEDSTREQEHRLSERSAKLATQSRAADLKQVELEKLLEDAGERSRQLKADLLDVESRERECRWHEDSLRRQNEDVATKKISLTEWESQLRELEEHLSTARAELDWRSSTVAVREASVLQRGSLCLSAEHEVADRERNVTAEKEHLFVLKSDLQKRESTLSEREAALEHEREELLAVKKSLADAQNILVHDAERLGHAWTETHHARAVVEEERAVLNAHLRRQNINPDASGNRRGVPGSVSTATGALLQAASKRSPAAAARRWATLPPDAPRGGEEDDAADLPALASLSTAEKASALDFHRALLDVSRDRATSVYATSTPHRSGSLISVEPRPASRTSARAEVRSGDAQTLAVDTVGAVKLLERQVESHATHLSSLLASLAAQLNQRLAPSAEEPLNEQERGVSRLLLSYGEAVDARNVDLVAEDQFLCRLIALTVPEPAYARDSLAHVQTHSLVKAEHERLLVARLRCLTEGRRVLLRGAKHALGLVPPRGGDNDFMPPSAMEDVDWRVAGQGATRGDAAARAATPQPQAVRSSGDPPRDRRRSASSMQRDRERADGPTTRPPLRQQTTAQRRALDEQRPLATLPKLGRETTGQRAIPDAEAMPPECLSW